MVEMRSIPGLPGYLAGEDGEVYSILMSRGREARPLKQFTDEYGYRRVGVKRGKTRTILRVHVLICRAWNGDKPSPKHEVCHWDGNKINNIPSNLRWGTSLENAADRRRHGKILFAENNSFSKLTNSQVLAAREFAALGMSIDYMSSFLNVGHNTLHLAICGKTYSTAHREDPEMSECLPPFDCGEHMIWFPPGITKCPYCHTQSLEADCKRYREALLVARAAMSERRSYAEGWEWKYCREWDEEDSIVWEILNAPSDLPAQAEDYPTPTLFKEV